MNKATKARVRRATPVETIKGKQWVSNVLNSVIGMWRDRATIDPVKWQRQTRRDWH